MLDAFYARTHEEIPMPPLHDANRPSEPPDPFERVTFRGHLMDHKTQAFIEAMEAKLGYELTIVQGCYSAAVAASGGTHDEGGVFDLAPFDHVKKVTVGRALGGFGWYRPELWRNGVRIWPEHIHFGIRDHGNLAPAAAEQQRYFDQDPRRNGLAGEPVDPNQFPTKDRVRTFVYPPRQKVRPPKVREAILAARAAKKGAAPSQVRKIDRALLWLRKILPR